MNALIDVNAYGRMRRIDQDAPDSNAAKSGQPSLQYKQA